MSLSPRGRFWLITVAALLVAGTTLALGLWQWSRARQKLAMQAAIERREAMPPLPQEVLLSARPPADLLHRQVVLHGSWVLGHTIFLDNRQMQGKVGFFVVTPFRLDQGPVVLVERGWVQRDFLERAKLPRIETPPTPLQLRGRIAPPPAKLYEFAGAQRGAIRQNIDVAEFRAETRLPLLDFAVRQTQGSADGLLRDWPESGSDAGKNYGYAFQWWTLSSLIAFLYVWFQFIVPRRRTSNA